MWKAQGMKPGRVIITIFALLIAGFGAFLAKDRIEVFTNASPYAATVVDCDWNRYRRVSSGGGSTLSNSYAPIAVSEEGFRAIGRLKLSKRSICEGMLGKQVTIWVNPEEPEKSRINSFLQLWLNPFIFLGFVAFGVASLLQRGKVAVGIMIGFILFGSAAAAAELRLFGDDSAQPVLPTVNAEKALQVCIDQAMRDENVQTAEAVKNLTCSKRSINDLTPLTPLTSLEILDLSGNEIISLAPLRALSQLRVLTLDGNKSLSSLEGLQGLTRLETLEVHCAGLVQIEAVSNLRELRHLDVSCNKLSNILPILNLERLETFKIGDNSGISDIRPVVNKPHLEVITMYHTPISDISPLFGNDKLRRANIGSAGNVPCEQIRALRSRLDKSANIIGPKDCEQK